MIGQRLLHYGITQELGEGGTGPIHRAEGPIAGEVADPDRERRFVREAKAVSALNHPNIITIYDISEAGSVTFIAKVYVKGKRPDQLIGRRGLALQEALKYAIQIAGALAKAHGAGIVHRSLKPPNLMVTGEGLVYVS